jgi:hypothetical protein
VLVCLVQSETGNAVDLLWVAIAINGGLVTTWTTDRGTLAIRDIPQDNEEKRAWRVALTSLPKVPDVGVQHCIARPGDGNLKRSATVSEVAALCDKGCTTSYGHDPWARPAIVENTHLRPQCITNGPNSLSADLKRSGFGRLETIDFVRIRDET